MKLAKIANTLDKFKNPYSKSFNSNLIKIISNFLPELSLFLKQKLVQKNLINHIFTAFFCLFYKLYKILSQNLPWQNLTKLTLIIFIVFIKSTAANANPNLSIIDQDLNQIEYFLLLDQTSGEILLEKNSNVPIAPSSMTKLMTAYVVFDQLAQGKISLTNQCLIGRNVTRISGSRIFLQYGDVVSIDKLITGLLTVSGNDAAIALAEAISGSVENFAQLMNQTGQKIGLKNSHFKNPHGLNQAGHYTTLKDLSIITRKINFNFPQYLHYFSQPKFTYKNITQKNSNPLIKENYQGVTGMKTGHTWAGGYGMVGTASRGKIKLIAIVNKARTPQQRQTTIRTLMNYGFLTQNIKESSKYLAFLEKLL